MQNQQLEETATFFNKAIHELANFKEKIKLLDFGCGEGRLVAALEKYGHETYGTDIYLNNSDMSSNKLLKIHSNPYKLPFDDDYFDIVISTSVLEHATNTEDCFREIYRILKPGGYAMHLFPGKYYLPSEPHIYVPFLNWFWPKCPKWWIGLWALLGIRNQFQQKCSWKDTYKQNLEFFNRNLCYKNTKYYQKLSTSIFGNFYWPMLFYINNSAGLFSKIFRKLPFKDLSGILSRECRMSFLIMQKIIKT